MPRCRLTAFLAGLLLAAGIASASDGRESRSLLERMFGANRVDTVPKMSFQIVADIPLPGPLPDVGPTRKGDRIELPVAGGLATSPWAPDSVATIVPRTDGTGDEGAGDAPGATSPEAVMTISLDPSGRFRTRFAEGGKLVLEKSCRSCKKGWKKKWTLTVPGDRIAPPLVTDGRVYFGAQDNRVYCLKRKNGHREWDVDVGTRISKQPIAWSPPSPTGAPPDPGAPHAVLVLPDEGSSVLALDARTGQELARFVLPTAGGTIRGAPITTPDGHIVLAREKYNPEEASLIVLQLTDAAAATGDGEESAAADEETGDSVASPDSATPSSPNASRKKKG